MNVYCDECTMMTGYINGPEVEMTIKMTPETTDDLLKFNTLLNGRYPSNVMEMLDYVVSDKKHPSNNSALSIKNVYFNDPATVVLWDDDTKTIVRCQKGDTYSKQVGLALCIAKKALGNKSNFNDIFKKWIPEEKKSPVKSRTVGFADEWTRVKKEAYDRLYRCVKEASTLDRASRKVNPANCIYDYCQCCPFNQRGVSDIYKKK